MAGSGRWALFLLVGLAAGCPTIGEGEGGPCDQACADQHLAYGIQWSVMSLFNAATGQIGQVEVTLDCSHGGTSGVSGTVEGEVTDAMLGVDLSFDLAECGEASGVEYDLVLDGTVRQEGTFENGGSIVEFGYTANAVAFEGVVRSDLAGDMEFDDSCALDNTLTCDSSGECETAGTVCGREFPTLTSTMLN